MVKRGHKSEKEQGEINGRSLKEENDEENDVIKISKIYKRVILKSFYLLLTFNYILN